MPASNTEECFREFIGQKMVGVLFGQLRPGLQADYAAIMVFEDGRGLGIYTSGAYSVVSAKDIESGARHRRQQLERTQQDIQHVVDLMGKLPWETSHPKKGKKKSAN